ncbi:chromatin regulatory protein sir2 [Calycina marina]|uniref:Chromatin regulatory protein sir2 n=1 Tax=Calycina marina TaxID=1763456 RepID=A0A9P7ZAX4_9HELO|nr:chromatin regulatory protein sir2 [Calycina marina]
MKKRPLAEHQPILEDDVVAQNTLPLVNVPDPDAERASSDLSDEDASDEESIDSFTRDTFEQLAGGQFSGAEPGICTLEEANYFRQLLREVGPVEFCGQTVETGTISAKKLMTAFGVRPPPFLEGQPDDAYYNFLSLAISRELSKRVKLLRYNTVDDAVNLIEESRNIIVLTGAGISTSLGIPDFRSKNTGLYAMLKELDLDIEDPQDVFSIEKFTENPSIFFSVAKDILLETDRFTPTHAFIHLLQQKGKLLTNYTQNIDNIEAAAGILPEKLIQCHGSFATATCRKCGHKVPGDAIYAEIKSGSIPRCKQCTRSLQSGRPALKRKRSKNGQDKNRRRNNDDDFSDDDDDDEQYDIPEAGIMKPDITFFGEQLPDAFSNRLTGHDKNKVDLVIVIGTSLKVAPVSEVVPYLPAHVPQVYISMDPVSHVNFDIDLLGQCDVVVAELCRRLGWKLDHPMVKDHRLVDITGGDQYPSRHRFNSVEVKMVKKSL